MMALRRTWDVGLRLCQERIAPAVLQRSVFHLSFSSKADVDDFDGEKKDKGKRKKETFVATKDVGKPACEVSQLEDDPDSTLIKALKKQLKDAIELVDNYQLQVRGTFKPFEVVPNNGGSDLTLRRVTGKEETLIKCIIDIDNPGVEGHTKNASDKEGSGSDDIDDLRICQRLTMNVQISKVPSEEENPRMAFLCSYTKGESLSIEDVAYLAKSAYEDFPYSGPYFPDLNDNLKEAFRNVIKARGINSSLANTIMEHLTNHYASEYVDWLKKTRQFLGR